ncbi:MAG: ABC-2 family transporter protein [Myxococcaceae bacterium]|nr:ABC-2 family transporter protein [Myxococcaceae bacterium]
MRRALHLLRLQLRTAFLVAAQYRWEFLLEGVLSLLWAATALAPLFVVYGGSSAHGIPGWTFEESLVVTSWFILLQGVLEGAINPCLEAIVDHIRKGTLDFVLLKPADAQFLVSTARFELWRVTNVAAALVVMGVAFHRLGRWPSPAGVVEALLLFVVAWVILYSLWILIVSLAFRVVKIDNLSYLFTSIFDAARWPSTVYRGVVAVLFTFVIPLALMTTTPAEALLGRVQLASVGFGVLGAGVFSYFARQVWLRSLRRYTSASS